MSCENHIHFDVNNILRTVTGGIVALCFVVPLGSLSNSVGRLADVSASGLEKVQEVSKADEDYKKMTDALTEPCLAWLYSKVDTKLEREAKTAIDEYFDGEVSYSGVCKTVLG